MSQAILPACRIAVFLCSVAIAPGVIANANGTENYPVRPIRLVVPFPPGGGADILARILGEKLTERTGQQVVIDNRGGAGGTIGSAIAAKAVPDGYTLLMASSNHPINAALYPQLPYHTVDSFSMVALVASAPLVLVVNPTVAAQSVGELIAVAKSRPGQLNFGSAGNASTPHLAGELFSALANVKIVHVPYKGSAQALTDLLGGQLALTFNNVLSVMPHVKTGKLRALAVTTARRSPVLPELPTVAEAGVPAYEVIQWWGVMGPARMSEVIVSKLHAELTAIISASQMKERFAGQGVEPVSAAPREFSALLARELEKWTRIIKSAGIRID